jgi:hypothetical protein
MAPVLAQHLRGIEALCRKYAVECLEAFGSIARQDFDSARSDVDFLVLFQKHSEMGKADQFLGLLEELEQLLGKSVDLVDIAVARNPYFVAEALRHRVRLYAVPRNDQGDHKMTWEIVQDVLPVLACEVEALLKD